MTSNRRSKTGKRRPRLASNHSGIRQSCSSFTGKSIRRSTISDAQEVTGFAIYVKNFFSNLFGCCAGGGNIETTGNDQHLRSSLNSSMNNMNGYTFVPVPNTNSNSQESHLTKARNNGNAVRRSQLIKDFKAGGTA